MLWPIGNGKVQFGLEREEILQTFEAIEAGQITDSVKFLALHEQKNILQPAPYTAIRNLLPCFAATMQRM